MFEVDVKNVMEEKEKEHRSGLGFWWVPIATI